MSIDADFSPRLNWLSELMVQDPDKSVRKLQWEALKYYPLSCTEGIRTWMTMRIAFLAADILTRKQENEASSDCHIGNNYVSIQRK